LGGGIGNYGRLVVFASTISNNTAKRGGGILNSGSGSVDITNSTISGNRASVGGGIYNSGGRVNITFSTITRNGHLAVEATRGGGGIANFGDVNIGNTILAGNTDNPSNADALEPSFSPDCSTAFGTERLGTFISFGGNLVGLLNTNCNWDDIRFDQFGEPSTGDALGKPGDGLDPLLDPLADNGGPTQTHALQKDSTARDRGTGRTLPPPDTDPFFEFFECPVADQRGVSRPQFRFCDVGAFEASAADLMLP
jgi:hypothetical protein